MSLLRPDIELHVTGWFAIIVVALTVGAVLLFAAYTYTVFVSN